MGSDAPAVRRGYHPRKLSSSPYADWGGGHKAKAASLGYRGLLPRRTMAPSLKALCFYLAIPGADKVFQTLGV